MLQLTQPAPANPSPTPASTKESPPADDLVSGTLVSTEVQTRNLAKQINSYFPHPLLSVLAVLLVFFALGKLVDLAVTGVFAKIVKRTRSDLDDKILELLHRPIFLSVILIGLGFSTYLLNLPPGATYITIHVLQTIAVLVWFRFGFRLTITVIDELVSHESFKFVTQTTRPLMINTVSIVLVVFAVYVVFLIWNIEITAWIASAGIIGLAVSFAAKDTLSNIFGGVAIFADKPFEVGDYVNLAGGERGVITHIGIRSTRILTRDDIEITVPNGILATTTIINESGGPNEKFRIRLKVGVAYGSDLDLVEKTLMKIAEDHPEVCADPAPRVRFRNFGDWALDHELLCWVEKPVLRGRILHELNREVYAAFEEQDIEIPIPKQEVFHKHLISNGDTAA